MSLVWQERRRLEGGRMVPRIVPLAMFPGQREAWKYLLWLELEGGLDEPGELGVWTVEG